MLPRRRPMLLRPSNVPVKTGPPVPSGTGGLKEIIMPNHITALACSAALGAMLALPSGPVWWNIVVFAYVLFGYCLPEVRFLLGTIDRATANAHLETVGFLGTIWSMMSGLPYFIENRDAVLSTFSVALGTTLIALVMSLANFVIDAPKKPRKD